MPANVTFAVRVPVEGWIPITVEPPDFKYLLQLARVSEALGYDFLLASDHLLNWIGSTPRQSAPLEYLSLPVLESWTTMSALAAVTEKIKLGNMVLCNIFRSPALLAKMASSLDVISGGRLVLAIGAGWLGEECRRYGLGWFPYEERIERLRESIRIIKALWTEKSVTFNGTYYRLRNAVLEPKPVTKPHPPIWLGGASERIMRMVAEEGDGWDPELASPQELRSKIHDLALYCDSISRNPRLVKISVSCQVILVDAKQRAMESVKARAKDLNTTTEDYMAKHLVGSPSEIASRMNEYVDAGVSHFTLYFEPDLRKLERFASEIIPQVG